MIILIIINLFKIIQVRKKVKKVIIIAKVKVKVKNIKIMKNI